MLPFYLLSIPVVVSLVLLAGHSLRNRGLFTTIFIFVMGLVFFAVKENLQAYRLLLGHAYDTTQTVRFIIWKVPAGIILGHLFTVSVTWGLADRILSRNRTPNTSAFTFIFLMMTITSSLAYVMEIAGTAAGWWTWSQPSSSVALSVPWNPIFLGWPFYIFGMMLPYLLIELFRLKRNAALIFLGHAVFFGIIYREKLLSVFMVLLVTSFLLAVLSPKRLWLPRDEPTDLVLRNIGAPLGWLFDHALAIAVLTNVAVVVAIHVMKSASIVIVLSFVAWFAFCAFGLFRLPHGPVIAATAVAGLLGLMDASGRVTFALAPLFLGLCFIMASTASKVWQISFFVMMLGCCFAIGFKFPPAQYVIYAVPVFFAALAGWFLLRASAPALKQSLAASSAAGGRE